MPASVERNHPKTLAESVNLVAEIIAVLAVSVQQNQRLAIAFFNIVVGYVHRIATVFAFWLLDKKLKYQS